MSDKQITVEKQLENCNGNLIVIKNCNNSIKINERPAEKSVGYCADHLNDSCATALKLKESFDSLLESSIEFFEKAGRKFDEADEQAAKSIEGK